MRGGAETLGLERGQHQVVTIPGADVIGVGAGVQAIRRILARGAERDHPHRVRRVGVQAGLLRHESPQFLQPRQAGTGGLLVPLCVDLEMAALGSGPVGGRLCMAGENQAGGEGDRERGSDQGVDAIHPAPSLQELFLDLSRGVRRNTDANNPGTQPCSLGTALQGRRYGQPKAAPGRTRGAKLRCCRLQQPYCGDRRGESEQLRVAPAASVNCNSTLPSPHSAGS